MEARSDWLDVEGIIIRQGTALDWDYIQRQLAPLVELKDDSSILDELQRRRIEFEA